MGAESSTLSAIDSLGNTLSDIERKLGVIEDVHLHHERTICHDNAVLVSGKMIQTRPRVNLIIGPLLGLVTQTSVRILVETDSDTELSINFFLVDELHTEARFIYEEVFLVKASTPTAKTFKNLLPGTKYAVYIGGCDSQSTLLKYAQFATFPHEQDTFANPKLIFTHSGRVDRISPGEVNLWPELLSTVEVAAQGRVLKGKRSSAGSTNSKKEVLRAISGTLMEDDAISSVCPDGPVHMAIHMGDFLSVDRILRSRVLDLLDVLLREDTAADAADALLIETEIAIRDAYRRALNSPEIARLSRRCGNVFLCGLGESGMLTSSLLGMGPPVPQTTGADREKDKQREKIAAREKLVANLDKMGFKEAKAARELMEEEDRVDAEAAAAAKIPKKRGEAKDHYEETEDDQRVPVVKGLVRRQRDGVALGLEARTKDQEEVRLLLLGAVVRMLRRVSWCYMRQLWDENYEAMAETEALIEANQRAVLRTRKALQVRKLLMAHLAATKAKVVREFGEEYKASSRVTARMTTLQEDVEKIEQTLRDLLTETSAIISATTEAPNGTSVQIGGVVLVIIETAWGWLGKDGLAQELYNRSVPLHPDIGARLDALLDGEGGAASKPDRNDGEENSGEKSRVAQFHTVVCVSSAPLLPTGQTLPPIAPDEPQMFLPASMDSGRLLRSIALWQQQMPERAALLVAPCNTYSVSGWAAPLLTEGRESASGWNSERCKLRTVLVGPMDKRAKAVGSSRHDVSERAPPAVPLADLTAGFGVVYDANSATSRRSFLQALAYPMYLPRPPVSSSSSSSKLVEDLLPGGPAGFALQPITDHRKPVGVTVGPVIGRVMPCSAQVLLEAVHDCHVELLCVDQVTGVEYASSRLLRAHRPLVFSFDGLVPGRPYDVYLSCPSSTESRNDNSKADLSQLLVRGSFTTPRRGTWSAEDEARKQAAFASRLRAGEMGAMGIPLGSLDERAINNPNARGREAVPFTNQPTYDLVGVGGSIGEHSLSAGGDGGSAPIKQSLDSAGAMRILVVGATKPSWLRALPHQDSDEVDESGLALDRSFLHGGMAISRAIADITARAYSGIDLVVHCGLAVDLSVTLEAAITFLARAEESSYLVQSDSTPSSTHWLELAENELRAAYRLHWGCSGMRSLLAHGCHLIVSSPLLDLLAVSNAASLRQLNRDLTPFCVSKLLNMVCTLEGEYQQSLWEIDNRGHPGRGSSWANDSSKAHFMGGGGVCVFPLRLRVVHAQDSFGTAEDGLLPEEVFVSLCSLLGHNEASGGGSYVNSQENLIDTLVVVSPLPVVLHDHTLSEATFLSNDVRGLALSPSECLRLLDILSAWMEEFSGRQVLVVCGGVGVGHSTSIKVEHILEEVPIPGVAPNDSLSRSLDQIDAENSGPVVGFDDGSLAGEVPPRSSQGSRSRPRSRLGAGSGQRGADGAETAGRQDGPEGRLRVAHPRHEIVIRQLCVGPLVGVYSEEQPMESGQLASHHRLFTFTHEEFNLHPHCGLITVPDNRSTPSQEAFQKPQLELCNQARLRAFQLEKSARPGASHGPPSTPAASSAPLELLADPLVSSLWRKVRFHLAINRMKRDRRGAKADTDGSDSAHVALDADAVILSNAVNLALDAQAVQPLFLRIHELLTTGGFAFPLGGGADVEETLLSISHWLLHHMPRESRIVCPPPSSLVVRLLWEKFALNSNAAAPASSLTTTMVGAGVGPDGPVPSQVVCSSMVADASYLAAFLRQTIEAQALIEHFALVDGIADGWE